MLLFENKIEILLLTLEVAKNGRCNQYSCTSAMPLTKTPRDKFQNHTLSDDKFSSNIVLCVSEYSYLASFGRISVKLRQVRKEYGQQKKLCYTILHFQSRIQDVKFLLIKIQFHSQIDILN